MINFPSESVIALSLPQFAAIEYADGTKGSAPVTWDEVPAENYAKAGKFEVTGKIGPEVTVKTEVSVKEIKSVEEVHASTVIGTLPVLPAGVEVTFTDESMFAIRRNTTFHAQCFRCYGLEFCHVITR